MNDLCNFADINKYPMAQCDLHRLIDRTFSASTFSKDVRQYPTVHSQNFGTN